MAEKTTPSDNRALIWTVAAFGGVVVLLARLSIAGVR